ncbi:MAG: alpha/beta hydrolase [Dehalococcoidia bacterium]|nr:alpha/beta hydrolase [Dehalococcoidia bacterium]
MRQEYVTIPSQGEVLEALLHLPPYGDPPYPAVVVCHPHPLYGGDMRNNIVAAACDGLIERGIAALRFNFRGVGGSTGAHSGGPGEQSDLLAALAFLAVRPEIAASRIGAAGYSFGAGIVLAAAPPSAAAIACIAPLASALAASPLSQWRKPVLLLAGDSDHVVSIADLRRAAAAIPGPCQVIELAHADHFFAGHEPAVSTAIGDFFAHALAPLP